MKSGRKYDLDWLRVLAFALLIPFHVGMLYASWFYPLKSPRLVPPIDWLLMLSTPWRLALVFLIAGVASRHLIARLGAGGFARDRLRRLLPVILFGMLVVNAPQTWIVAKAHGLTQAGLGEFWPAYLHNDQHLMKPPGMAMPRWDHLWFLLYLLPYGWLLALAWKLKGRRRGFEVPVWLLLAGPAVWLVVTNMVVDRVWPRTDTVFSDWGAHLQWAGLFIAGVMLAGRADAWRWMEQRRAAIVLAALLLGLCLLVDHALWQNAMLTPPSSWLSYDIITGLFGWAVILAACGLAARHLNRSSPLLSYFNTAILPVYVLHQPILFAAGYAMFPLRLPLAMEAVLLACITFAGSVTLYHVAIRPFGVMRFLFGLKPVEAHGPPALEKQQ